MEDIWTIIFTSGTTGVPKGVVLPFRILEASKIPFDTANTLKLDRRGDLFSRVFRHFCEKPGLC